MGLKPRMGLGPINTYSYVSFYILSIPVMGLLGKSPWILMVQCQNSAPDVFVG